MCDVLCGDVQKFLGVYGRVKNATNRITYTFIQQTTQFLFLLLLVVSRVEREKRREEKREIVKEYKTVEKEVGV